MEISRLLSLSQELRECTGRLRRLNMPVFLSHAKSFEYAVNTTDDVQQEFDRFYATVQDLLDRFYPERTIVITSADPEFVTPAVKAMLRRKNRLMRRGRTDEADVLAGRIGRAIISYNSVELSY